MPIIQVPTAPLPDRRQWPNTYALLSGWVEWCKILPPPPPLRSKVWKESEQRYVDRDRAQEMLDRVLHPAGTVGW